MARRTNYGFEKRQKELKRQKKKVKEREERRARKEEELLEHAAEEGDLPTLGDEPVGELQEPDESKRKFPWHKHAGAGELEKKEEE